MPTQHFCRYLKKRNERRIPITNRKGDLSPHVLPHSDSFHGDSVTQSGKQRTEGGQQHIRTMGIEYTNKYRAETHSTTPPKMSPLSEDSRPWVRGAHRRGEFDRIRQISYNQELTHLLASKIASRPEKIACGSYVSDLLGVDSITIHIENTKEKRFDLQKTDRHGHQRGHVEYQNTLVATLTHTHGVEEKVVLLPSGEVERLQKPTCSTFDTITLKEELAKLLYIVGDGFYTHNQSTTAPVDIDNVILNGEILPPDPSIIPITGSGKGWEESPRDPRRMLFYKELPGVLFPFKGSFTSRGSGKNKKNFAYQGYAFTNCIILDCEKIGNAIFIIPLKDSFQPNIAGPANTKKGIHITAEEISEYTRQYLAHLPNQYTKKELQREHGAIRIIHPVGTLHDESWYKELRNKLSTFLLSHTARTSK